MAQVLLTLPYSFSQLGMLSGVLLQLFYGFMGSWTAYLISVLYVEYRSRKEKENFSFKNHVIQVRSLSLPKTPFFYAWSLQSAISWSKRLRLSLPPSKVVRGSGRASWPLLEGLGTGFQLHLSPLRVCYPADRLRQVRTAKA